MLISLLLLACGPEGDTGDSAPVVDTDPPEPEVCEPAGIGFDGDDPPRVGSVWKFWLTCDGSLQLGASKTSVEPTSAGTIISGANTPEITWNEAGTATLHIQTGRFKGEREVTVEP